MKLSKKLSVLFAVMIAVTSAVFVLSASASALKRSDTGYGNWMGYVNDDGTFTVTACRNIAEYTGTGGTLTIPSYVDGRKVTGIGLFNGEEAFYTFDHSYSFKAIVLPDTIENVEAPKEDSGWPYIHVFSGFSGLEKLVLPNNNKFDSYAAENLFPYYSGCLDNLKELSCTKEQLEGLERNLKPNPNWKNLTTLTFYGDVYFGAGDYRVTVIDDSGEHVEIRNDYPKLKNLNLISSESVYLSGLNVTEFNLSDLKTLKDLHISGCNNLNTLSLPSSLRELELSDCPKLTTVSYPGDIRSLSVEKLSNCPNVNIPVIYINYFDSGNDFELVDLRSKSLGHFSVDSYSPYANSRIEEIHIDSRRIEWGIDKIYFIKMSYLKKIVVEGSNSKYYTRDGVLYWGNYYYDYNGVQRYANDLAVYPAGKSTIGTLNLPSDVTCIYAYALDSCKFSSITIPENIHKDYYWDSVVVAEYVDGEYDHYYANLTDFFPGKIRMVKNSRADSMWSELESRVQYYTGSTYKISYNLNGGTNNAANPKTYIAGNELTIYAPTKPGYQFLGWIRNDSKSKTDYINTTERRDYFKDLEFTAQWKKTVAAPVISSLTNSVSGVQITWGKVSGAAKYRVFRKTASTSWTKIGDTAAVTWTDKTAKSGSAYTYTVRCLSADGSSYTSSYNTKGKSVTYVAAPVVSKLENTAKGTKLTWTKVPGAAQYRVFVKSGSSWKKLADAASNTYVNTSVKAGTAYTYTVRAMNAKGTCVSAYNAKGWSYRFVAAPAAPSLKNSKNGVVIAWKKPAGAAKFRIFRKTGNGGWTKLADTTAVNFVDKTAKSGVTYTYTIRCISSNGKSYTSTYNTKGTSIKCKR